ncbi:flippase [Halalkalicoccus ordinarius]|uniref:flippase n=1 Tax=Halalkalicoccus ordinarius TaxID=3116651 RepID=UPI00300E7281
MSDQSALSKLAGSALLILLATIFGRGLGFVGEVIIVRSLEPSVYGQLALAYTVVSSLATLTLVGIHEGVTRQFSATSSSTQRIRIVWTGYSILLVSSIVSILGIYLLRWQLSSIMGEDHLSTTLLLFLPYLFVYPLWQVSKGTLRGQQRTLPVVISNEFSGRLTAIICLGGFILLGETYYGPVVYWIGYPLISTLVALYFIKKSVETQQLVTALPDAETLRKLWSFSWPLAVGSSVFLLLSNLDILMIGYFLESESVGFYRSVQPLKQVATFALGSFTFLFLPLATEHYADRNITELDELFTVSTKWVLIITLPPLIVFGFFSTDIVRVFFGREYLPAAPVLSILVLGLLSRALSGLDGDMVKAINRPRIELYAAILGMLANFTLNILLIPVYGITGAALATVTGYIVYNTAELICIYRLVGATPFSLNIVKYVATVLLLGMLASVLITPALSLIGLAVLGICFTLIQPIVLILTHSVEPADLALLEDVESKIGKDLKLLKRLVKYGL